MYKALSRRLFHNTKDLKMVEPQEERTDVLSQNDIARSSGEASASYKIHL